MKKILTLLLVVTVWCNAAEKIAAELLLSGKTKVHGGDLRGAIVDLTTVIDGGQAELLPEAYWFRAMARYHSGDSIGVVLDLKEAVQLDPSNADAYFLLGQFYQRAARFKDAIASYDRSLELQPGVAKTWSARGDTKVAMHDYPGAISDYTKAIEADPKFSSAYFGRAYAKGQSGGREAALAELALLIATDPGCADAYHYRGQILYGDRSTATAQAALQDFDKAIALNPNRPDCYKDRANCRAFLGDQAGAEADVAKYRELMTARKK